MQLNQVIPRPVKVDETSGEFEITDDTVIVADSASEKIGRQFSSILAPALGRDIAVAGASNASTTIHFRIDRALNSLGDEGYRLSISPNRVDVTAPTKDGLFWAIQTIRQLLPVDIYSTKKQSGIAWTMPCGTIEDQPRFPWRGVMLDCCRHFMPIEFVYKFIDLLSLHKLNVFHWHLTEDQGWRIEIKKYPKLTEIGAWRKQTLVGHGLPIREYTDFDGIPHGGFYAQEQIRDVVRFAAERNVTVVPEIEMPGHAVAAIAAYPQLGNTGQPIDVWCAWGVNKNIFNVEESTIQFCQDVLREVLDLFPSKYIHIGGDEAPKDQWKTSPSAQARIKELGLHDEDHLQSWFIGRMNTFLIEHGRVLVGWDEILEGGLAPGAMVVSWRGEKGGIAAANAGHEVVMAPQQHLYFDHYQTKNTSDEPLAIGGCTTVQGVYEYEPVPAILGDSAAKHIRGVQGQLWTEYVLDSKHAERMLFPRAAALAEVAWSSGNQRDWGNFATRLNLHLHRLEKLDVCYGKFAGAPSASSV